MKKSELQIIPIELNPVIENTKIEFSKAESHALAFAPSMKLYTSLADEIKSLNKADPSENDAKKAREARLKMVKVRTGAEEIKDIRKEGIRAEGDLIQALFNVVKNSCLVTENEFTEIEKHQERKEQERQAKLTNVRGELLFPYGTDTTYLPLGSLTDEQFERLLENEKLAFNARKEANEKAEQAKIEAEKLAEEKRLADIEADRIAREEQAKENERLRKENEAKEAQLAKEREEARIVAERLSKENEAKLAEQKRLADIEAKKQADELAKQREASERLAKELQAKKDAEAKEQEAKRLAQLAPDKEKINALYKSIQAFELPVFASDEAKEIGKLVQGSLSAILTLIKNESLKLK